METIIPVRGAPVPPATLFAPRSYLLERKILRSEEIAYTSGDTPSGHVKLRFDDADSLIDIPLARREKLHRRLRRVRPVDLSGRVVFDMRYAWPENWAHFLINHLPLLALAADRSGLVEDEITVLLPARTPAHILRLAELLGLTVAPTDAPVQGRLLSARAQPKEVVSSGRRDWIRLPFLDAPVAGLSRRGDLNMPRRVFLSRRGTRALENEAEVEAFLAQRGYAKIYAEDIGPDQQLALFHEAEHVVAIHGAALGPLMYRSAASNLAGVIELMPAGHMSLYFRVVAHQVGCDWSAVRGRLKPEYVRHLYDGTKPFVKFSLDSFSVDLDTLALAMERAAIA